MCVCVLACCEFNSSEHVVINSLCIELKDDRTRRGADLPAHGDVPLFVVNPNARVDLIAAPGAVYNDKYQVSAIGLWKFICTSAIFVFALHVFF